MEVQYYDSRHTGNRIDEAIAKIPKTENPVVPSLIVVNSLHNTIIAKIEK